MVDHQWSTWTRTISNFSAEHGVFEYPHDLPGLAGYDSDKYPAMAHIWNGCNKAKCNQYFLSGKLAALDSPGEWFHDHGAATLYFYPPKACRAPAGAVEVKARDLAFSAPTQVQGVGLSGMVLKGATVAFHNCTYCAFTNLAFEFATYSREVVEYNNPPSKSAVTQFAG